MWSHVLGKKPIPYPWPSGTVFENIKSGEQVTIRKGQVVRLPPTDVEINGRNG